MSAEPVNLQMKINSFKLPGHSVFVHDQTSRIEKERRNAMNHLVGAFRQLGGIAHQRMDGLSAFIFVSKK